MKSVTDEQPLESLVVKEHVHQDGENTDASSPGPGLRGDMSPLTPEKTSPEAPRGDMSPLTPPPLPRNDNEQPPPPGTERSPSPRTPPLPQRSPSPRTPPMPPPDMLEQHVFGEEIVADEVSEGEFNVSPPKG